MREKVIKPFVNHAIGKIPLIECAFHLFTTSDMEKLVNSKDFKEIFPCNEPWIDHGYYGITFYDYPKGQVAIMLSPRGLNHNVIAHEIHHATLRIGNYIGATEAHGVSEEFYALIAGYLGDFIYQFMDVWKHKVTAFQSSIVTDSAPVEVTAITKSFKERTLQASSRKSPVKAKATSRKKPNPKRPSRKG